jgi:hypothetical protein
LDENVGTNVVSSEPDHLKEFSVVDFGVSAEAETLVLLFLAETSKESTLVCEVCDRVSFPKDPKGWVTEGDPGAKADPPKGWLNGAADPPKGLFNGAADPPKGLFNGAADPPEGWFNGAADPPEGWFNGAADPPEGWFNGAADPPDSWFNGVAAKILVPSYHFYETMVYSQY